MTDMSTAVWRMRREAAARSSIVFGMTLTQVVRAAREGTLPIGRALGPFEIDMSTVAFARQRMRRKERRN